jgi:hypothetical protein
MNIRVMGLPGEVPVAVSALKNAPGLWVVAVSGPYANRGDDERVRVYVTALHRDVTADQLAGRACVVCDVGSDCAKEADQ